MLILSRTHGQEIYIDTPQGQITVKVTDIYSLNGQQYVKLGFDAPKEFKITRDNHPSLKQQDAT